MAVGPGGSIHLSQTRYGNATVVVSLPTAAVRRTGKIPPPERREQEQPAADGPGGRRVLVRGDQVRPDRVEQRFEKGDDPGLLRGHRPEAAGEQPVRGGHLDRAEHGEDGELRGGRGGEPRRGPSPSRPATTMKPPMIAALPNRFSTTSHALDSARSPRRKSTTPA